MVRKHEPVDVRIGKFDILATYTYARALHDGLDDDKAKQRGMVPDRTSMEAGHGTIMGGTKRSDPSGAGGLNSPGPRS